MSDQRSSFWKTTVAAALASLTGATAIVAVIVFGWTRIGTGSRTVLTCLSVFLLLLVSVSAWSAMVALWGSTAVRRSAL